METVHPLLTVAIIIDATIDVEIIFPFFQPPPSRFKLNITLISEKEVTFIPLHRNTICECMAKCWNFLRFFFFVLF